EQFSSAVTSIADMEVSRRHFSKRPDAEIKAAKPRTTSSGTWPGTNDRFDITLTPKSGPCPASGLMLLAELAAATVGTGLSADGTTSALPPSCCGHAKSTGVSRASGGQRISMAMRQLPS